MRIYLSGPMTGYDQFNFPAFHEAAARLRALGHDVDNPAEHFGGDTSLSWETYMREDVKGVAEAEAIVTLPGYAKSRGAMIELNLARALGLKHYLYTPEMPYPLDAPALVGLVGYAGAGKDEVARVITGESGFEGECVRVAFADALRRIALAINPILRLPTGPPQFSLHEQLAGIVGELGWERAKREFPAVRNFPQAIGTEVGREVLGENVWVDLAMKKADEAFSSGARCVVITDVRFENEVEAIRTRGGKILLVSRPGVGPVNGHVSEMLPAIVVPDGVVHNDGSLKDLRWRVADALEDAFASEVVA